MSSSSRSKLLSRRRFLGASLACALAPFAFSNGQAAPGGRRTRFVDYPFKLGVSSGTPSDRSVVLWTRLCPAPLLGGGMTEDRVRLRWEIAADPAFGRIVQAGSWYCAPELAHSAHIEVQNLAADTEYFYRFMAGDEASPVGRTRTLPSPEARVERFRFALASCQQYEQGYFHAYRHAAADDPRLMLFVGDSIYESSWGNDPVRAHFGGEPQSLTDYRVRHAQYRLDPDLAAMHAAVPWLVTVDDHEIDNDWAADISEHLDPRFVERRAAALQAFFEHMPLPMGSLQAGARLNLYRSLDIGRLIRLWLLDTRQYRSPPVCTRPGMAGGGRQPLDACAARFDPSRSMLGLEQEAWLARGMATSEARWNVVAQPTLFSELKVLDWGTPSFDMDGWDGYAAARERLLQTVRKQRLTNPLFIGGDVHCSYAADVKADFSRPDSPTLGTEVAGTSLISAGYPQAVVDQFLPMNPHMRFGNSLEHGYLLFDVAPDETTAQIRTVASITDRNAAIRTLKHFTIEAGRPGLAET